jgi:hypothetical protein
MEQAHASTAQLPFGSPIISLDTDVQMLSTDSVATSSSTVGRNIAHHFDEFRRYKRSSMASAARRATATAPDTSSLSFTDNAPASVSVSGFRPTLHCCRTCHTLLPVTCFYPSNLKRFTFYCKTCCVAKKHASTHKARRNKSDASTAALASTSPDEHATAAGAPVSLPGAAAIAIGARHGAEHDAGHDLVAGPATDAALKMMNRLRRMCARPSECGFQLVLPSPVSLDFDVKVARQLLLWWNATSALGSSTAEDHELRFVPWLPPGQQRDDPTKPLQPWEVIPVTRVQARRLTSTPPDLWMQLLDPAAAAHVVTKSAERKRIILGEA